jgi:hypothetical protein
MFSSCIIFFFCLGQMIVPIGLIYVDLLVGSSFSWMLRISKSFKLPTFSAPQSRDRIMWVFETERDLVLGKRIITLSPAAHIKLDAIVHAKSHHLSLLLSKPSVFHSLLAAPHHFPLHHDW